MMPAYFQKFEVAREEADEMQRLYPAKNGNTWVVRAETNGRWFVERKEDVRKALWNVFQYEAVPAGI